MRYWQLFWAASLIIAGASFAGITAVVTVRGFKDLREMFSRLEGAGGEDEETDRRSDAPQGGKKGGD